jgi:hypothetical protein
MTTQALPSWDAEMQRQVTATTVAQYRIVELEAIVNRERARATRSKPHTAWPSGTLPNCCSLAPLPIGRSGRS